MDFSDAASGGEESSGGYGGGALPPPRRLSSLPTLAEDSVGGGSRSTRTRSPSPSVGTLAAGGGGGGSRTASGAEGGSAAGLPPQHPTSSGERERGGGREEGAFSRGTPRCLLPRSITSLTLLLTAGRRSRCRRCGIRGETERRRDFFSRFQKTRGGRARENAPEEKLNLEFFPSKKNPPLTQPLGLLLRLEAQGQRPRKGQVLRLPARRGCFHGEQPQQQCEQQQRLRRRLFERRGGRRHRRLPCAPVGRKHQRAAAAAAPGRLLPPRRGVHGPELGPGGGADGARVREFLFSSKKLKLFYERGV